MFIPSENRERAAMFDIAVEAAHEALTHPGVIEILGDLTIDLRAINETAFLPDYRDGGFHVPREYADDLPFPSCHYLITYLKMGGFMSSTTR